MKHENPKYNNFQRNEGYSLMLTLAKLKKKNTRWSNYPILTCLSPQRA